MRESHLGAPMTGGGKCRVDKRPGSRRTCSASQAGARRYVPELRDGQIYLLLCHHSSSPIFLPS
ncbi:hypothetical protein AOX55_00004684 (plasmid) [Sinorhizobium fredii CCBAU 25509]|nr:hypothetical protein AOX55_00004684 [Sinorhizobium fredii CCBAU 25509]